MNMNNMNDMLLTYQMLKTNPREILSNKFNIPENIDVSNPNDIIQYLLNTGQITQGQVNNVMEMKNNPFIQHLLVNR